MVYPLDPCSCLRTGTWLSSPTVSKSVRRREMRRVVNSTSETTAKAISLDYIIHLKTAHQGFIDAHHTTSIVKLAAIVWRGEQRHELSFGEEFITVFDYLMRPAYQIHVMAIEELRHDVWTERKRDSSVIFAPTLEQRDIGNVRSCDKNRLMRPVKSI